VSAWCNAATCFASTKVKRLHQQLPATPAAIVHRSPPRHQLAHAGVTQHPNAAAVLQTHRQQVAPEQSAHRHLQTGQVGSKEESAHRFTPTACMQEKELHFQHTRVCYKYAKQGLQVIMGACSYLPLAKQTSPPKATPHRTTTQSQVSAHTPCTNRHTCTPSCVCSSPWASLTPAVEGHGARLMLQALQVVLEGRCRQEQKQWAGAGAEGRQVEVSGQLMYIEASTSRGLRASTTCCRRPCRHWARPTRTDSLAPRHETSMLPTSTMESSETHTAHTPDTYCMPTAWLFWIP
jgi:hypothetical protein